MSQGLPKKIRYEYIVEENAKLNYTHGVWGGINPQGEIELNFYHENDKPPKVSERLVGADGSLGVETLLTQNTHQRAPGTHGHGAPEFVPEEVRTVVRNIHSKILVNYHTARALLDWLEEKIDTLEAEEMGTPFPLDVLDIKREQ